MDNSEKINKRLKIIKKYLQNDGGDLELINISGNKITIKLQGACSNCPHANETLKNVIEKDLRENIDKNIIVEKQ